MNIKRIILLLAPLSLALLSVQIPGGSGVVVAGPTLIRDNRIHDLSISPVLGRGYSLATNTFQSSCMKNVEITEPSYDFNYTFESLEKYKSSMKAHRIGGTVDVSHMLLDFKGGLSFEDEKGDIYTYHSVIVTINVDTYYASVNEARSRLSEAARALLLSNDIPGFFYACGSYYVRSLGRNAKFVSVFTYQEKGRERNKAFELELELAIKGFGTAVPSGVSGGAGFQIKNSFKTKAQSKKLTITSRAWGLGKNQNATLISYDLPTFKTAIKDAFISMQHPLTGRVTTMEIIPWVENAEFQNYIKLEEDTTDPSGKKLDLFEKKRILNLNTEFLAQIQRTDRSMMEIYYKAILCRQVIDSRWKIQESGGDKLVFIKDLSGLKIQNNRTRDTMTINDLDAELSPEKIDELLARERRFMRGIKGEDGVYTKGAAQCIKTIMTEGIFKKSWRDIQICQNLRSQFAVTTMNSRIDDYCMPKLARPKATTR